jgi:hypothetical protein
MSPEVGRQITAGLNRLNRPPVRPCGYQQLTVTGATAQALTIPEGAVFAKIRVMSATTTGVIMYYSEYGDVTAPTTTTGMPLVYLDYFELDGGDSLVGFRVIAVNGSHTLNITYFK